jgi:hypothetical protein
MSSIEMISTMPLAELLATKSAVDAALIALASGAAPAVTGASGKGKKAKAAKEESKAPKVKRVTQGSAWADFTKMICSERAEAYAAFKEASEIKQGVAPRFVASYRSEHEAEWDAFQAEWNAKHPKLSKEEKASAAASVASEEEAEEMASIGSAESGVEVKKRKGPKKLSEMTAEELEAHKAKVAAKKAAKAAPTVEEAEAKASAPFVIAAPVPVPVAAPAPVPVAAPAPVPVAAPAPEEEEEAALEPRTFTTGGQKYIRLWNTDAESWASGHLWMPKKKGSSVTYGSYVGELMADGSIGTDGDEPEMP